MGRKRRLPVVESGMSYCGKRGRLIRFVVDIGMHIKPEFYNGKRLTGELNEWCPREPGVRFVENGEERVLFLSSFEDWLGGIANSGSFEENDDSGRYQESVG